jgi:N-hydroxyarylamine O-acetyltransferase
MPLSTTQIDGYLRRLRLKRPDRLDADFLDRLQYAHLTRIPFEALDICPGERQFTLDIDDIYEKIVIRNRGGFCYELNTLLSALLESLGYDVERKAAWFTNDPEAEFDPHDHMLLIATVPREGGKWFVDAAAGRQNPDRPVPLDGVSSDGRYRTWLDGELWRYEVATPEGTWFPQIAWRPETLTLDAFRPRCRFFQTDPASVFKQGPLCTIVIPEGRLTISRWNFIETRNGIRTERRIGDLMEMEMLLATHFGITMKLDRWWAEEET